MRSVPVDNMQRATITRILNQGGRHRRQDDLLLCSELLRQGMLQETYTVRHSFAETLLATLNRHSPSIGAALTSQYRRGDLHLDGVRTASYVADRGREQSYWGLRTGPHTRKAFRFSELVTTDDEEALFRLGQEDLGTIRWSFWEARLIEKNTGSGIYSSLPELHSAEPVHERSKKAGAHCVTLGDDSPVPPARYYIDSEIIGTELKAVFPSGTDLLVSALRASV
ncbi:hypothetical protein C8Q80DRAFT_362677 [Daedaleopsis nitida]|nr:hypothetical protein C8Q80DRAFT_362677 [Daedaleopsis nitida]